MLVLAVSLLALACGERGPSAEQRADARSLRQLMNQDPTDAPLEEATALETRRPVTAAEIIEARVLPAARAHLQQAEALSVSSEAAVPVREHLVTVYRERITALEGYQRALAGGTQTRDEQLLDAMDAMSDVDMQLLEIHRELDVLSPLDMAPSQPSEL